jgi:fibronectin type 3 domain-containing protein
VENDIYLHWTEPYSEGGIGYYIVYRSTDPEAPGDSLDNTAATEYTDVGVAKNALMNYYYTVKVVDLGGQKSAESNKVGEFDCDLITLPK